MVFGQNDTGRPFYVNPPRRNSTLRVPTGDICVWGGGICGGFRAETSLHAAAGGTASRLSRSAIRDLGLISHRAETRPLSPPLSLTD